MKGTVSQRHEHFRSVATRKDGAGSGNPIVVSSERWTLEEIQQCTHDKWLKVLQYDLVTIIYCMCFVLFHAHRSDYITLTSWVENTWHMLCLWLCHSSDNSQVFQREVLRSRRNSTTVVNRPNMVQYFIKHMVSPVISVLSYSVLIVLLSAHILSFAGPFVTHSRPQHQTSSDQTSKRGCCRSPRVWRCFMLKRSMSDHCFPLKP